MPAKILIIDDDPVQRRLLTGMLAKLGYDNHAVESGELGLALLDNGRSGDFAAIVLDLVMPQMDGFEVLEALRSRQIQLPVIVQTAKGGIETVVKAMRAGAHDFVVKPVSPERLKVSLENALSINAMRNEVTRIRRQAAGVLNFKDMICNSGRMQQVLKLGQKAAASDIPVLIEGESGVGKELIARAIQGSGKRAKQNFITVNCGALPENLIESVLFGHEKGAFTGAIERHSGKFAEADKGTLFLDEVGELPPQVQVKLLRALQEGEVDPIGAKKPLKSDFRLISATNRSLQEDTAEGNFREDLYYRLSVFPIWIPPLRERREDVSDLANHFLARFAIEEGRTNIKSITPRALQMLQTYDWPGNIRQLENAVFRAVVLCDSATLDVDDFPQIANAPGVKMAPATNIATTITPPPLADTSEPEMSPDNVGTNAFANNTAITTPSGEVKELEEIEAEVIRFAVELYGGNMSEVSKRLGIGRSTLYRRLKELGLDGPPSSGIKSAG